jgi:hypothetical protein
LQRTPRARRSPTRALQTGLIAARLSNHTLLVALGDGRHGAGSMAQTAGDAGTTVSP